jgi:hypothetical protein
MAELSAGRAAQLTLASALRRASRRRRRGACSARQGYIAPAAASANGGRHVGCAPGRCWRTRALPWQGQIARATRGRDLHLNVPFPRKQPDLLMAESPPTGGLSALKGPRSRSPRGAAPVPRSASAVQLDAASHDASSVGRQVRVPGEHISGGWSAPCRASGPSSRPSRSASERRRKPCLRAGCRSTSP